jgi:methyl-accepting chemotaxis protein
MREADRLRHEQEVQREQADAAKRVALIDMAARIETETSEALELIRGRTAAMATRTDAMRASALRTGASSRNASTAAAQALANALTVASAAEELTASIREISSQVSQSSEVVARAVAAGNETRARIETLNQEVERIGSVADIIRDRSRPRPICWR